MVGVLCRFAAASLGMFSFSAWKVIQCIAWNGTLDRISSVCGSSRLRAKDTRFGETLADVFDRPALLSEHTGYWSAEEAWNISAQIDPAQSAGDAGEIGNVSMR